MKQATEYAVAEDTHSSPSQDTVAPEHPNINTYQSDHTLQPKIKKYHFKSKIYVSKLLASIYNTNKNYSQQKQKFRKQIVSNKYIIFW